MIIEARPRISCDLCGVMRTRKKFCSPWLGICIECGKITNDYGLTLHEILTKRGGKWAMVSKDRKKVLKYWNHKPSDKEFKDQERRVQFFKHKSEATTTATLGPMSPNLGFQNDVLGNPLDPFIKAAYAILRSKKDSGKRDRSRVAKTGPEVIALAKVLQKKNPRWVSSFVSTMNLSAD